MTKSDFTSQTKAPSSQKQNIQVHGAEVSCKGDHFTSPFSVSWETDQNRPTKPAQQMKTISFLSSENSFAGSPHCRGRGSSLEQKKTGHFSFNWAYLYMMHISLSLYIASAEHFSHSMQKHLLSLFLIFTAKCQRKSVQKSQLWNVKRSSWQWGIHNLSQYEIWDGGIDQRTELWVWTVVSGL